MSPGRALAILAGCVFAALGVPVPNARQLSFMDLEHTNFFHFGLPTFWDPPREYLYTANPTYHDCKTTAIDHSNATGSFYPCLDPVLFNPTDFDADDWMKSATDIGAREICLTAHHEGGFALWPSNFTSYSVAAATAWRGGRGDVLREFADAANRWNVSICYYLNVACDHYETEVQGLSPAAFIESQLGMVREVLENYGCVCGLARRASRPLPPTRARAARPQRPPPTSSHAQARESLLVRRNNGVPGGHERERAVAAHVRAHPDRVARDDDRALPRRHLRGHRHRVHQQRPRAQLDGCGSVRARRRRRAILSPDGDARHHGADGARRQHGLDPHLLVLAPVGVRGQRERLPVGGPREREPQ